MRRLFQHHSNARQWLVIALGCLMDALAVNLFLAGNDIAAGGLAGIATALMELIPVRMSVLLVIMNIPLVVIALIVKEWSFVRNSIVGFVVYTVLVEVTSYLPTLTRDPLLASLFGGACIGLGMAFMTLGNGSIGGTELIIRVLASYFPDVGVEGFCPIIDGSVVIFAMVVYRDVEVGLYAILTLAVVSKLVNHLVNRIVWGAKHGNLCLIVTVHPPREVARAVMDTLGIAVTKLDGTGMFAGTSVSVLLAVVHEAETYRMRAVLEKESKGSFVIILPVNEAMGGRLSAKL